MKSIWDKVRHNQFFFSLTHLISFDVKPLSANFTKWLNTLKQFVGNLPTNCLSVFDHFVGLALKGLSNIAALKIFFFPPYSVLFSNKPFHSSSSDQ